MYVLGADGRGAQRSQSHQADDASKTGATRTTRTLCRRQVEPLKSPHRRATWGESLRLCCTVNALRRGKVGLRRKLRAVPDIVNDNLTVALVDLVEKAVRLDDELAQGQRRILGDAMTAAWEGLDASQRLVYPCGEVLRGQAIVLVDVRERFGVGRCRII